MADMNTVLDRTSGVIPTTTTTLYVVTVTMSDGETMVENRDSLEAAFEALNWVKDEPGVSMVTIRGPHGHTIATHVAKS